MKSGLDAMPLFLLEDLLSRISYLEALESSRPGSMAAMGGVVVSACFLLTPFNKY